MIFVPSVVQRARAIAVRGWRLLGRVLKWPLIVVLSLTLLFGIWPCIILWDLNQALFQGDHRAMERLVDLDAIRGQLKRRMNKDRRSAIDHLSDDFVQWLDAGLNRRGRAWFSEQVTPEWVREQWLERSASGVGVIMALRYVGFDSPKNFRVRIGRTGKQPLTARLHLGPSGWRLAVLYY